MIRLISLLLLIIRVNSQPTIKNETFTTANLITAIAMPPKTTSTSSSALTTRQESKRSSIEELGAPLLGSPLATLR